MPKGILFWILMLLWIVLGLPIYSDPNSRPLWYGRNILLFLILVVLGWQVFGEAIK